MISPNSVRAIGKFGGHLPWHYKAIGWSLLGVWFIMFILILVGMHMAGYEPERPGRPQPRHGGR